MSLWLSAANGLIYYGAVQSVTLRMLPVHVFHSSWSTVSPLLSDVAWQQPGTVNPLIVGGFGWRMRHCKLIQPSLRRPAVSIKQTLTMASERPPCRAAVFQ